MQPPPAVDITPSRLSRPTGCFAERQHGFAPEKAIVGLVIGNNFSSQIKMIWIIGSPAKILLLFFRIMWYLSRHPASMKRDVTAKSSLKRGAGCGGRDDVVCA
jgi:hypothetical protein